MNKETMKRVQAIHEDWNQDNTTWKVLNRIVLGSSCDDLTSVIFEFLTDSQLVEFIDVCRELMSLRNLESGDEE